MATAAGTYRLLATICNVAVADEVIAKSPCRVRGGSDEASRERPTAESVAQIDAAVEACPGRYRLAISLAVWCQLRRGEILGLHRHIARRAVGRTDLRLHDLRHSGLTWTASLGATAAELMHRGGHSPAAALRYQHAPQDRDAVLADAWGPRHRATSYRCGQTADKPCQLPKPIPQLTRSSPNGIRTRVATLRGWCPRPLDDGAERGESGTTRPESRRARGEGLEPSITGPEPVVLPITPPPNGWTIRLAECPGEPSAALTRSGPASDPDRTGHHRDDQFNVRELVGPSRLRRRAGTPGGRSR